MAIAMQPLRALIFKAITVAPFLSVPQQTAPSQQATRRDYALTLKHCPQPPILHAAKR